MASVRMTRTGRFELTIRNRLLPRPVYLTFDNEAEATAYGEQVDRLLAAGIIPADLVDRQVKPKEQLAILLRAWINSGQPARTDVDVLAQLVMELGALRLDALTYAWAEQWVRGMKVERNLAPSTIRKRIGSLSRALDWYLRAHPDIQIANPLRLLPRGAATYTEKDAEVLAQKNLQPKFDIERDRRQHPGEHEAILGVIEGAKRPDRERPLLMKDRAAVRALYMLIRFTGLRLREAYRIRRGQVLLAQRVIRFRASKQWRGKVKSREVPIRPELYAELVAYLEGVGPGLPDDLLFPFLQGPETPQELDRTTARLSSQFARIFEYAGCPDLTEHDLRHEATCQWFELRGADGQHLYREAEIHRIMGWSGSSKMPARYASFRVEDLAARMWSDRTGPAAAGADVASARAGSA